METIYEIVRSNPEFSTWTFGLINALWIAFVHFNNKSHAKAMEKLKSFYRIKEAEVLPLIKKLQELEEVAGEAKELAISYQPTAYKREHYSKTKIKLEEFVGQFGRHKLLVQAIRDLDNRCAIMTEDDPHDKCREDVLEFYQVLLKESGNVKRSITA